MGLENSRFNAWAAGLLAVAWCCGIAAAQQAAPRQQSQVKAVTLTSLTEQGFEIKAVARAMR